MDLNLIDEEKIMSHIFASKIFILIIPNIMENFICFIIVNEYTSKITQSRWCMSIYAN